MFSGKIYHQIAVVQHGARRLAMIGYQPTYLEDAAASRAILHDITKWIGYNRYKLPKPEMYFRDKDMPDGDNSITITVLENGIIKIVFDSKKNKMTDLMKSDYTHWLNAEIIYGGNPIKAEAKPIAIKAGSEGEIVITFGLNQDGGDKRVDLDPKLDINKIEIKAWVEGDKNSPFKKGSDTARATINLDLDTEAPYITKAKFYFGKNNNKDTLKIQFNEPIFYDNDKKGDEQLLLVFWLKNSKGEYEAFTIKVNVLDRPNENEKEWIFEVIEVKDANGNTVKKQPNSGDFIYINVGNDIKKDPGVHDKIGDKIGNYVEKEYAFDTKCKLELGEKYWNPDITVIPGGKIPQIKDGVITDTISLANIVKPMPGSKFPPIVDSVINGGGGSLIIIDPGASLTDDGGEEGNMSSDIERVHGVILDAVGNKVAETDDRGNSEHLGAAVAEVGGKYVLAIGWDNKNQIGRDVGAGTYVLIVESKWKDNGNVYRNRKLIPVPLKKKGK
jgi:hypothetical protein